MLEEIEIQNFQSHKHTKLRLHPGINAITGTSDTGKSAIIRAVKWLATNKPRGIAFKTYNAKEPIKVSLILDGKKITKTRSKTVNQYKLGEKEFDVVKSDVPDEIRQALNFSDVTIRSQHDKYFLLQDTPGEVARKLNKVVDLGIINYTTKEINSNITETNREIARIGAQIESIEQNIDEYKHLDEVEELLSTLSNMLDEVYTKQNTIDGIETTITKVTDTKEAIAEIDEWLEIEDTLDSAQRLVDIFTTNSNTMRELEQKIEKITQLETRLEKLSAQAGCESIVNAIATHLSKRMEYLLELRALSKVLDDVRTTLAKIDSVEETISELMDTATGLLKEYDRCPLCGGSITNGTIAHIKEWL